jgi:hypothetical protein
MLCAVPLQSAASAIVSYRPATSRHASVSASPPHAGAARRGDRETETEKHEDKGTAQGAPRAATQRDRAPRTAWPFLFSGPQKQQQAA